MIDRKLVVRARDRWPEPQKPVTMQGLWRLVLWGSTAAVAMLVASLASRSEIGMQRAASALASLDVPSLALLQPSRNPAQAAAPAPPQFDAEAETKRLTDAVKDLKADNGDLKTRLAALEHSVDDVTGSIAQSAKATAAAAPSNWPADSDPAAVTPADVAALVTPGLQPTLQYGVGLGDAAGIPPLRLRWTAIHAQHARLFTGLIPTVALRGDPAPNRAELQLVLGPLPDIDAATRLCAAVAAVRLSCEPTVFSPQHLTLE